jgi:magnesium transporter
MSRFIKKRSHKAGLPPGSLVAVGDGKSSSTRISLMDYSDRKIVEKTIVRVQECIPFKNKPTVTWVNVEGLHDIAVLAELGRCMGLHPLVMEDILNTDQRPKIEDFGRYVYLVLKELSYDEAKKEVASEQVSIIIGKNFVVSLTERESPVFARVKDRIRSGKGRLREHGADYLAYTLLDSIVDNYFGLLERVEEQIEEIEESLVNNPTQKTMHQLNHLKREMIFLRKSLWPMREMLNSLDRVESGLVTPNTKVYLKDVQDHILQVIDTIESFREILSGMLDAYLSSVSNRLNEVMKVLTIIATLFMPLTFLAGVYGMNFKFMPELSWKYGYPLIWAIMIGTAVYMLYYFRKKKWI